MFQDWIGKGTCVLAAAGNGPTAHAAAQAAGMPGTPWWVWVAALFVTCFLVGIVAVLSGIGGGTLFTPIVGAFFPFGSDFVKAGGLLVALTGALAAGPGLLRANLASFRLLIPPAIVASSFSIIGAYLSFGIPSTVSNIMLGLLVFGIIALYVFGKRVNYPEVRQSDGLGSLLGISGAYYEPSEARVVQWRVWKTPWGLSLYAVIGIISGMFGIGAGWANVPVFNLLMGAPLKVAVASSKFLLSVSDTSAAWIYFTKGAVIPIIAVPAVLGIMFGSFIGVRILKRVQAEVVRWIVILILLVAGVSSLLKGLGLM